MINRRKEGAAYEDTAASFLQEQGLVILEKNFRCRTGEIDIIAREGSVLIFAEVKYRSNGSCGSPLEAVGVKKQRIICRVALYYLQSHGMGLDQPCRFDVLGLHGNQIEHIRNAFDFQ